ncbi:MAG: ferrochelatase [Betaproteobacteria bacterium]
MRGILLVNLGTPAAPTADAVRSYLAEFLGDPRVVEIPRFIWLPILYGLVLRRRPAESAAKYAKVWTSEGSPLMFHTRRQAGLLAAGMPEAKVAFAMRYGEPSIASGLAKLRACDEVLVVPMYPQYARSTTESIRDVIPKGTRMLEDFHDHPAYIAALAALVREDWAAHGQPQVLVMSFHGLPQRSIERGDPYYRQCMATAALLAQALGLEEARFRVGFQSRFGPAKWIQPYTSDILARLGSEKTKRVDVFCPGFVADCLETLEEIAMEGREIFQHAGGGEYRALPCLNEHPAWIRALAEISRTPP